MTALAADDVGVASIWLTPGIVAMELSELILTPYAAWSWGLGRHRSNNHVIPFFQFPFENRAGLRICMVCDSKRNFDRFHRVVRMELPNNGSFCFRYARHVLGGARQRSTLRSGVNTGALPRTSLSLTFLDPIALIKGQNLLGRHRGL